MDIQSIQNSNDIQLTNIVALILLSTLLVSVFLDVSQMWLQLISALGLLLVGGYLVTVGMFLTACERKDNNTADALRILANCCQAGHLMLTASILILLATQ